MKERKKERIKEIKKGKKNKMVVGVVDIWDYSPKW